MLRRVLAAPRATIYTALAPAPSKTAVG